MVPVAYMFFLYRARDRLNPGGGANSEVKQRERDRDKSIAPIRFLFHDLKCDCWYHEVVDM